MKRLSQKGIVHIGFILLLLAGIVLGVYLVQQKQIFAPKASHPEFVGPETSFYLVEKDVDNSGCSYWLGGWACPFTKFFIPQQEGKLIAVDLYARSDFDAANLFKAKLKFPSDLLEVVKIETQTGNYIDLPVDMDEQVNVQGITAHAQSPAINLTADTYCQGTIPTISLSFNDTGETYTVESTPQIIKNQIPGRLTLRPLILNDFQGVQVNTNYSIWIQSTTGNKSNVINLTTLPCIPTPTPYPSDTCRAIGCAAPEYGCYYENSFTYTCDPNEYSKLTCGNLICVEPPVSPIPGLPYFIKNWLEKFYDNNTGEISLVGGVPDPGFKTNVGEPAGLMATIYFRAKEPGKEAQLSFTEDSSILRNSDNQNILIAKNGITVSTGKVIPTPPPGGSCLADSDCSDSQTCSYEGNACPHSEFYCAPGRTDCPPQLICYGKCVERDQKYCAVDSDCKEGYFCEKSGGGCSEDGSGNIICAEPSGVCKPQDNCKLGVNTFKLEDSCEGGLNYRTMHVECYDGFSQTQGGGSSCKPADVWKTYAEQTCLGRSSCKVIPPKGSGDGNGDGKIDLVDMSVLLSKFNKADNGGIDMNSDGKINSFDLALLRKLLITKGIIRVTQFSNFTP